MFQKKGCVMSLRFAVVVGLSILPTLALAQGTPQQRAACRPDVAKFCKGKGEDPGVLLTCLEDNKDKISEKCRKVIEEK
jgi:Cysteine rich repeat